MKFAFALVAVFAVASYVTAAVADSAPKLNVEPSCRGAIANIGAENQRDLGACMKDENDAKATLDKNWNTYAAADRARCTRAATMGGQPSYVELLVCLEMIHDAKSGPAPALSGPGAAITPAMAPPKSRR